MSPRRWTAWSSSTTAVWSRSPRSRNSPPALAVWCGSGPLGRRTSPTPSTTTACGSNGSPPTGSRSPARVPNRWACSPPSSRSRSWRAPPRRPIWRTCSSSSPQPQPKRRDPDDPVDPNRAAEAPHHPAAAGPAGHGGRADRAGHDPGGGPSGRIRAHGATSPRHRGRAHRDAHPERAGHAHGRGVWGHGLQRRVPARDRHHHLPRHPGPGPGPDRQGDRRGGFRVAVRPGRCRPHARNRPGVRGQLAAIVTVFAWGFVVEQLIGGLFDSAQPYLPYTAATTMAGATLGGGTSALPFAAAAALVAGVAALLSAVAAQTTVQRDVA